MQPPQQVALTVVQIQVNAQVGPITQTLSEQSFYSRVSLRVYRCFFLASSALRPVSSGSGVSCTEFPILNTECHHSTQLRLHFHEVSMVVSMVSKQSHSLYLMNRQPSS